MEKFDLQPILENDQIRLRPLIPDDFEALFNVASDPLIWEQHPNKNRYKREVFETFFKGAIESKGALLISIVNSGEVVGSSRFYDYDPEQRTIAVGYTFFARSQWGNGSNIIVKTLMLDHAFRFVDRVIFHIGAVNIRSQKAIEKLGAVKIEELEMNYYGEDCKLNYVYEIKASNWLMRTI